MESKFSSNILKRGYKLKTKYALIGTNIVSIIAVIILILYKGDFIFKFGEDIWGPLSTFFGALSGAGLSGLIAILVFYKDKSYRIKESQIEKNDNFIKSFELIKMWSSSALTSMESMKANIKMDSPRNKRAIENEIIAMSECIQRLEKINDDYIPREIYKDFIDIKVNHISTLYKIYVDSVEWISTKTGNIVNFKNPDYNVFLLENHKKVEPNLKKCLFKIIKYKDELK